jgi:hypothetical protein
VIESSIRRVVKEMQICTDGMLKLIFSMGYKTRLLCRDSLYDGDHTTSFGDKLFAVPIAALWS